MEQIERLTHTLVHYRATIVAFTPVLLLIAWDATYSATMGFAGIRFTIARDFAHIPQARAMLEEAQKR